MKPQSPPLCRYLRAKNPYGMLEGGSNPWQLLDDANTIFWCVRGNGGIGPDSGLITPDKCIHGRSCYRSPENATTTTDTDP